MISEPLGRVLQRLPRGRNRAASLLQRRWPRTVEGRDVLGLRRSFDLGDLMQARWYCGVPIGLADDALSHLRPGDWAVDVGANIGIVTGQMCRAVGTTGRVTALEPIPVNVDRLQALKSRNGLTQLDIHPVAAGAAAGRQQIRLAPDSNSGWASFSASWLDSGSLEVEIQPLDALLPQVAQGRRVAFMKIDVEGYEFEVLEGAQAVLAADRPVLVVELNDPLLQDRGKSSAELLAALEAQGYQPVTAVPAAALVGSVLDVVLTPR